jgi:exopolysaccharide/PEP-CTERM locus tyrosine autokinase
LGKIFTALEKYRNERTCSIPAGRINQADLDALLKYDRSSGKLDIDHPDFANKAETLNRLQFYCLIQADGMLTPAGLAKAAELENRRNAIAVDESTSRLQEKFEKKEQEMNSEGVAEGLGGDNFKEIDSRIVLLDEELSASDKGTTAGVDASFISVSDASEAPESEKYGKKVISKDTTPTIYDIDAIDKKLVSFFKPQSFEAEQFKILRTNLLYPAAGKAPRTVLVTSTAPGEGKSFVAANLAISVARDINKYVLLIDCDLRRPVLHYLFGFNSVPGLSDYLSDNTALRDLLLRTAIEKLTILPAGKPPDNPSELLSSKRMSAMINEVAERYSDRIIIIDSPPPKLTAEAQVLANQVDGILLVIKHGSAKKELVADLIERIGKTKIIGAVVNDFDIRSSRYYKKYYGKYYGKYETAV